MTRRELIALAAAGASVAHAQQPFTTVNEDSYAKLVASGKGKVVLVDFWATWCAPCREEMPQLARMDTKLRPRGFSLFTVSADEPDAEPQATAFLKKAGISGPTWIRRAKDDDHFIRLVDPKWTGALPALFLYDRSGKKVHSWFGSTAVAEIEAAVTKLL